MFRLGQDKLDVTKRYLSKSFLYVVKGCMVRHTRRMRFRCTCHRHGDGSFHKLPEAEYKSPTVRQGSEPKFLSQNYNFCHYTRKAFLLLFHFNHLNQVYPQTMLF